MATMGIDQPGKQGTMKEMVREAETKLDANPVARFSLWDPWNEGRWRSRIFWGLFSLAAVSTVAIAVLVVAGQLDDVYRSITDITNGGQAWTEWMREHPQVFPPLAFAAFLGLGALLVHWRLWAAAYLMSYFVFFLGFLAGHVYW